MTMSKQKIKLLSLSLAAALVCVMSGCADDAAQQDKNATRSTRVTVMSAQLGTVEDSDTTIGRINSVSTPMIMAEVEGRLTRVLVDAGGKVENQQLLAEVDGEPYRIAVQSARADLERLKALIENQQRLVKRNEQIYKENFITETVLEDSQAQLKSLIEQSNGARARLEEAERNLRLTRTISPFAGTIDQRLVSTGEYVKSGQALFKLVSQDVLTVNLPFPETIASRITAGLDVSLYSPLTPDVKVGGKIRELRPALNAASRTIEAIVDVTNPGSWRIGASILGTVIFERRESIVVSESSVVERPDGVVVYVIEGNVAKERKVQTGVKNNGMVEIRSGLEQGESVAVKGAAYLTDNTPVAVEGST